VTLLNLSRECRPIRSPGQKDDIGDLLHILAAAQLLQGGYGLRSGMRSAKYLGLNLPFWAWDIAIAKFAANGIKVPR
jgi:hypothetical protein